VKPYRKSNKNDFLDAEAIAEAVTKQNMRFAQRQRRRSKPEITMSCSRSSKTRSVTPG
jgi:hypothetical protein